MAAINRMGERKPRLDLLTQPDMFLRPGMPPKPGQVAKDAKEKEAKAEKSAAAAAGGGADDHQRPGQCTTPPALQAIIDRAKQLAQKSIIPKHLLEAGNAEQAAEGEGDAQNAANVGEKTPGGEKARKKGKYADLKLAFPDDHALAFFSKPAQTDAEEGATQVSRVWSMTKESAADFPLFLTDLAELCRTLGIVLSSRCDYLRQKLKDDPQSLAKGSTTHKLLLQLATATQNGVYVLQKSNYVLRLHFTDDEGFKEKDSTFELKRPQTSLPLDEEDSAEDCIRVMHTGAAKLNTLMENILYIVPKISRAPNQERKKGGSLKQQKDFAEKFMAALTNCCENGFEPRRRKITKKGQKEAKNNPEILEALSTVISPDDFDLTMKQLYGLMDHFNLLIAKSSTVARLLDTKLKGAAGLGLGFMIIMAICRAQRNWRKRKAAEKAAAEAAGAA
ncbi:unnamed protein product [Amoebophrya sp. A25]|nr:unnamed protein product [Amoebophrya sp. A25]|eukprot:GSA25T00000151001.1